MISAHRYDGIMHKYIFQLSPNCPYLMYTGQVGGKLFSQAIYEYGG